jgi:hypothetical protein
MTRDKYMGMDVHQATTVVAVIDARPVDESLTNIRIESTYNALDLIASLIAYCPNIRTNWNHWRKSDWARLDRPRLTCSTVAMLQSCHFS